MNFLLSLQNAVHGSGLAGSGAEHAFAEAVPGPQKVLAGQAARRRPLIPADWKTALLWHLLVMATALLGGMAFSLIRQIPSQSRQQNDQHHSGKDKPQ